MLRGILLFEEGGFQQIGEIRNVSSIIGTIDALLPKLRSEEKKLLLASFSPEELEQLRLEKLQQQPVDEQVDVL